MPISHTSRSVRLTERHVRQWVTRFLDKDFEDFMIVRDEGESPLFPPLVEDYIVKMACERPDPCGRSLSQWDCQQIAEQLVRQGVVRSIIMVGRIWTRKRAKIS